MNIRRLAAWALIFCGLLLYVLVFEKPAVQVQKPAQRGDYEKAFGLSKSDITSLSIADAGRRVTLGTENFAWRITGPAGAEALPEQCESMVTAVADTVVLSVVEENPADLRQYGLDAPEMTITINPDNPEKRASLALGKKSPSGVSIYALDEKRGRVILVGTYISFSAQMFLDNITPPAAK